MLLPFLAGVVTQGLAARRSAQTMRQQQKLLQRQAALNEANYYQQMHNSGTDAPQTQAQLATVRQMFEKQNGNNANTALAGNLTREQQLAGNQQTARNMAAAVNQITRQQSDLQRQLRQEHQRDSQQTLSLQRQQLQQKAQNQSRLGQNLARSLVSVLANRKRQPRI